MDLYTSKHFLLAWLVVWIFHVPEAKDCLKRRSYWISWRHSEKCDDSTKM